MIVGVTGSNCSGKGEVAKYLAGKGFRVFSLSDCLREEAKKRNLENTRENLTRLGNALRKKYGPGILAKMVIKKFVRKNAITTGRQVIIDSIRNPGEVKELKKLNDFFLLGVKAPLKVRFLRSIERNRPGDMPTFYKFRKQEEEENRKGSENFSFSQQLKKCMELSDKIILNNGSISDLHRKIDMGLSLVPGRYGRFS